MFRCKRKPYDFQNCEPEWTKWYPHAYMLDQENIGPFEILDIEELIWDGSIKKHTLKQFLEISRRAM